MKHRNVLMIGLAIVSALVIGAWTNSAPVIDMVDNENAELANFYAAPFLSEASTSQGSSYELADFYAAPFLNTPAKSQEGSYGLENFYAAPFLSEVSDGKGWNTLDEYYANYFGDVWFDKSVALSQ